LKTREVTEFPDVVLYSKTYPLFMGIIINISAVCTLMMRHI